MGDRLFICFMDSDVGDKQTLIDLLDRCVHGSKVRTRIKGSNKKPPPELVGWAQEALCSTDMDQRIEVFDSFYMEYPNYITDDVIYKAIEMVEIKPSDPSSEFHLFDSATWLFEKFAETEAVTENRACLLPMVKCILNLVPRLEEPQQVVTCYEVLARVCITHEDVALGLFALPAFIANSVHVVECISRQLESGEYEEFCDCLYVTSSIFFLFKELLKIPKIQENHEFVHCFAFLFIDVLQSLNAGTDDADNYESMVVVVLEFLRLVIGFFPDAIIVELIQNDFHKVIREFLMSPLHCKHVLDVVAAIVGRKHPALTEWAVSAHGAGVLDVLAIPGFVTPDMFLPLIRIFRAICSTTDQEKTWELMNSGCVVSLNQTILSNGSVQSQLELVTVLLSLICLDKKDWLGYVCNNYFVCFSLVSSMLQNDNEEFCSAALAALVKITQIMERQPSQPLIDFLFDEDLADALRKLDITGADEAIKGIEALMDTL